MWSHDVASPEFPLSNYGKHIEDANAFDGRQRALLPVEIRSFDKMLWTIAVILLVLWALGLTTAYTASGLIHILLVLAIVVVLIRVIQGRRAI